MSGRRDKKKMRSLKAEDIGTYHDVFVLAGVWTAKRKGAKVTLELIAEGRRIADKLGKSKKLCFCAADAGGYRGEAGVRDAMRSFW